LVLFEGHRYNLTTNMQRRVRILFQSGIPARDRMKHDPALFECGQRHDKEYMRMIRETARVAKKFSPRKTTAVLEVGAGTGLFSEVLAPRFPQSTVFVISEPDRVYLERIPKKIASRYEVFYVQARAQNLRWGSRFDVIACTETYHHIPDKEKLRFFRNLRSLLAPQGVLVIGDNFIPYYNRRRFSDRIRALHKFWDPYIKAKEKIGDREGAKTFSDALRQAETGRVEYKTSLTVFEGYTRQGKFSVALKKATLSSH